MKAKSVGIVASKTMGSVTSIRVKEGDRVKANDVLMVLDGSGMPFRERVPPWPRSRQAKASFWREKTWQQLLNKLYDENVISRQEMDQMDAKKKIADAEYERSVTVHGGGSPDIYVFCPCYCANLRKNHGETH